MKEEEFSSFFLRIGGVWGRSLSLSLYLALSLSHSLALSLSLCRSLSLSLSLSRSLSLSLSLYLSVSLSIYKYIYIYVVRLGSGPTFAILSVRFWTLFLHVMFSRTLGIQAFSYL